MHCQIYTVVLLDFDILVELGSEIFLLKDIHDANVKDEYKAYERFKQSNRAEAYSNLSQYMCFATNFL